MKLKIYKKIMAAVITASVFTAAIPAVCWTVLGSDPAYYNAVYAADAQDMAVSNEIVHIPGGMDKELGYVFGIREVGEGKDKKAFLYYQDARVRDENGQPLGSMVNIGEADISNVPKPDYKTMKNLTGKDATKTEPATGEKLDMQLLVDEAVNDYFFNEDTGAWYTETEKVEKIAVPYINVSGKSVQEPGIVIVPEIPASKCFKDNSTFIQTLIKAYDAEEGHSGDNAFKYDPMLCDSEDGKIIEIYDEGYDELLRIFQSDIAGYASKQSDIKKIYTAVVSRTQAEELNRMNRAINASDDVDLGKVKWVLETKADLESAKKVYPKASGNAKFWVPKGDDITVGTLAAGATGSSVTVSKTIANGKYNNEVVLKAVSADYGIPTAKLPDGKGTVYASCTFYITPAKSTAYKEDTLNKEKDITGVSFSKSSDKVYSLVLDEGKSYKLPFALSDGINKSLLYEAHGSGFSVSNGIVSAYGEGSGTIKVYPADADDLSKTTLTVNVNTNAAPKAIRANTNTISMYPGATQTVALGTVPPSFGKYTYMLHGLNSAYTAEIKDDQITITADSSKALPKLNRVAVTIIQDGKNMKGIKNLYLSIRGITAPQKIVKLKETNKKLSSDGTVEINIPRGSAYNLGVAAFPVTCDTTLIPKVGVGINDDGSLEEGFSEVTAATYDKFIFLYGEGGSMSDAGAVWNVQTRMDRLYSRSISGDPTAVARPLADDTDAYSEWLTFYEEAVSGYNKSQLAVQVDTNALKVSGDVVGSDKAGTYYLQFTTAAKNSSNESLKSNIYKINIYDPGSSIIINDKRDTVYYDANGDKKITDADKPLSPDNTYSIVCGQLMTSSAADTTCERIFKGGTTINIAEPYCLGDFNEEIEWKCSKPGAVMISKGEDYKTVENKVSKTYSTLDLKLCQACTTDSSGQPIPFTITGTSKYTKQKFTFKVSVINDADLSQSIANTRALLSYTDNNGNVISQPRNVKVGDTFNVYCSSGSAGVAGRVKLESTDKKVLTVTSGGVVKAVGSGTATIKATMIINDKKSTTLTTQANFTVE